MNVKAKFEHSSNSQILHFSRILYHFREFWKYASFEGSGILGKPCFYRQKGSKKALQKSAIFRNSSKKNRAKLVQNVKNQFLHQLPWRGIWVV